MSSGGPFLHGFFGAPNFGDELLCRAQIDHFGVDHGAVVATARVRVGRRTARGCRDIRFAPGMLNQLGFWSGLPLRLHRLRRCESLIIGGGGLLNDTFGPNTIMRSAFDAAWAVKFGLPIFVLGLEIGSVDAVVSRRRASFLLRHAREIGCRDPDSLERARSLVGGTPRLPVFEMPDLAHGFLHRWFVRTGGSAPGGHCVYNPRLLPFRNPTAFVEVVQGLCRRFERVTLAAAQPGEEKPWMEVLKNRPTNLALFVSGDWEPTLEVVREANVMISERFHYLAAGVHARVPSLPILFTGKARHLSRELGLESMVIEGDRLTSSQVLSSIEALECASHDRIVGLLGALESAVCRVRTSMATDRVTYGSASRAEAALVAREILREAFVQKRDAAVRRLRGRETPTARY